MVPNTKILKLSDFSPLQIWISRVTLLNHSLIAQSNFQMWVTTMLYLEGRAFSLPQMTVFNLLMPVWSNCIALASIPPPSVFIAPQYSSGKSSLPDSQNTYFTHCQLYSGVQSGWLQGLSQGWAQSSTKSQWEPCWGLPFKIVAKSSHQLKEKAAWEWRQPREEWSWQMQRPEPADILWSHQSLAGLQLEHHWAFQQHTTTNSLSV